MSFDQSKWVWRNGEIIRWEDATTHVSAHALHYGSGVFEGIRCYATDDGPAIFRLDAHLDRLGVAALADRPFGLLSTGERRRVQIARALMPEPDLLILDEPAAGLDLGARETLVRDLGRLAGEDVPSAIVLVTHHVEEIPIEFGHGLVLGAGRAVSAGRIDEAIGGDALSAAFGLPIRVDRLDGRFSARLDAP